MKKGFIAFGIVNTITVFLSLYTFAMSMNSGGKDVNDDPFDMENITEVKKRRKTARVRTIIRYLKIFSTLRGICIITETGRRSQTATWFPTPASK